MSRKNSTNFEIQVDDKFWNAKLDMNSSEAIFFQWKQLEKTKCIDNFRLLVGIKQGFREGWFFSDSDAYKWLDAACRIYSKEKNPKLLVIINEFIELIIKVQEEDGYIYTYNQFHFPGVRWKNLQIEHELYCFGHLIEAGISHFEATGEDYFISAVKKAANLLYNEFFERKQKNTHTPGHQEIEIALIKLYKITQEKKYLDLSEYFLKTRGKFKSFFFHFLKNSLSMNQRSKKVKLDKENYMQLHPEESTFRLPGHVESKNPRLIYLRSFYLFGSGKYNQQHTLIEKQKIPEGHSVRFAYMETAAAMLCRERPNEKLIDTLESAWDHMVQKRMFVTGGVGSIPVIEGFGYDYELDPEYAYCETCAALGSMFWNWEMSQLTKNAKYADLFEWQLYNASSVGMGADGKSYLYRNPLSSNGKIERQEWYEVPCCPSNISRTWASIEKYIYSYEDTDLWIHQFIGNSVKNPLESPISIKMESTLPWNGNVKITIKSDKSSKFSLHLRIPSWTQSYSIKLNGIAMDPSEIVEENNLRKEEKELRTASGYNPYQSYYITIKRIWDPNDSLEIEFPMKINILKPDYRVKALKNTFTVTRGPLVYCMENIDNGDLDIFHFKMDPAVLKIAINQNRLGGIWKITGKTAEGHDLTMIPYYSWGNRGKSKMSVAVKLQKIS